MPENVTLRTRLRRSIYRHSWGWSLGIRCGTENIIVAARELADAERAAINREIDLKYRYAPDMPPCRRVLSVNPDGEIVDLLPGTAGGMSAR